MNKIDFSDFYKFLVSIGILLVALAFLLPWLLIIQPLDAIIEQTKYNNLNAASKEIVAKREVIALFIVNNVQWFSIILLLVGALFILFGIIGWLKKQKLLDEQAALERDKLKKEVENMSPAEVEEKAEQEAKSDLEQTGKALPVRKEVDINDIKNKYLQIESTFITKFDKEFSTDYLVLPNKKIGKMQFDLILTPRPLFSAKPDAIVEVKYLRNLNILYTQVLFQILLKSKTYIQATGKNVVPILLICSSRETIEKGNFSKLAERMKEEARAIGVDNLLIEIIAEEDIEKTSLANTFQIL